LIRLLICGSGNLTTKRPTPEVAIPPPQAIRDLVPRFSFGADSETERFRCFDLISITSFNFGALLHGEISRLRALKNLSDIHPSALRSHFRSSSGRRDGKRPARIDRGDRMAGYQLNKPLASRHEKRIRHNDESADPILSHGRKIRL